ncbi:hypothetical protein PSEUDO8AS_40337 [Pseudomonas sp. 8AS]|nr:hypothetical protein PSEUDO8AS_40337 [Pseudomonas sp. 8AS]
MCRDPTQSPAAQPAADHQPDRFRQGLRRRRPDPPHPAAARPGTRLGGQRLQHEPDRVPAGNRQGLPAQGDLQRAEGIRRAGAGIRPEHLSAQGRGRRRGDQGGDPQRAGVRGRRRGRDLLRADQAGQVPLLRQGPGRQGHAGLVHRQVSGRDDHRRLLNIPELEAWPLGSKETRKAASRVTTKGVGDGHLSSILRRSGRS